MEGYSQGGLLPEPTTVPVKYSVEHGCYYLPSEVIERYGKEILDRINSGAAS